MLEKKAHTYARTLWIRIGSLRMLERWMYVNHFEDDNGDDDDRKETVSLTYIFSICSDSSYAFRFYRKLKQTQIMDGFLSVFASCPPLSAARFERPLAVENGIFRPNIFDNFRCYLVWKIYAKEQSLAFISRKQVNFFEIIGKCNFLHLKKFQFIISANRLNILPFSLNFLINNTVESHSITTNLMEHFPVVQTFQTSKNSSL